ARGVWQRAARLGGQGATGSAAGGVGPAMRTNTSRIMTAFSDLAHPPGTAVYPVNQQIGRYLEEYADRFGVSPRAKLGTRVAHLERACGGTGGTGRPTDAPRRPAQDRFRAVVLAPGAYQNT